MKVKYRQRNNFGCISFALANIFDDHRFLEDLPTEGPVRMADVRGKMVSFLPELFIQETFVTSNKFPLGMDRLDVGQRMILKPISEDEETFVPRETIAIPFIVIVVNKAGNQHAIAVIWDLETDKYHWIDSNMDEIIVDSSWFLIMTNHIVGVYQFGLWEGGDCGLMLPKNDLPHIFAPEE